MKVERYDDVSVALQLCDGDRFSVICNEHALKLARWIRELLLTDDRIRMHWDECWREPSHHGCCVAQVEWLERELAECKRDRDKWHDEHDLQAEWHTKLERELASLKKLEALHRKEVSDD